MARTMIFDVPSRATGKLEQLYSALERWGGAYNVNFDRSGTDTHGLVEVPLYGGSVNMHTYPSGVAGYVNLALILSGSPEFWKPDRGVCARRLIMDYLQGIGAEFRDEKLTLANQTY